MQSSFALKINAPNLKQGRRKHLKLRGTALQRHFLIDLGDKNALFRVNCKILGSTSPNAPIRFVGHFVRMHYSDKLLLLQNDALHFIYREKKRTAFARLLSPESYSNDICYHLVKKLTG